MNSAPLLTSEVARLCSVSSETVRYWEKTGRLPAINTAAGGRLFARDAVERLARERGEARALRTVGR